MRTWLAVSIPCALRISTALLLMSSGCSREQASDGKMKKSASIATRLASAASSETGLGAAGAQALPVDWLESADLGTDIAETIPRVAIENAGNPLDRAVLDGLALATNLVTWPENVTVSAAADVQNIPAGVAEKANYRAFIYLRSQVPLTDRWYALRVSMLPSGLHWANQQSNLAQADGSLLARFRPGSDPVMTDIQMCAVAANQAIRVTFSERMTATTPLDSSVHVSSGDASVDCAADSNPIPTDGAFSVSWKCAALDPSAQTRIHPEKTFKSLSGKLGRDPNNTELDYSFMLNALPTDASGCRVYRS
jgi:hypothetical protein